MTEPGDDPYEPGLGEQEGDDHDDDDGDESPRAVKRQKRDMPVFPLLLHSNPSTLRNLNQIL
jgi:hypothetical protein